MDPAIVTLRFPPPPPLPPPPGAGVEALNSSFDSNLRSVVIGVSALPRVSDGDDDEDDDDDGAGGE